MAKDQKWLCQNETCKALIGYVDTDSNQVKIKYKDLYVTVEGGRITLICRHCAKVNTLTDQTYLDYLEKLYQTQSKAKTKVKKEE